MADTKKFTVEVSQEQMNYLQRLGYEVDNKVFLIDRMFANHAMDTDNSMFDSIPFKHLNEEYEKARAAWEEAKLVFQHDYLDAIVKEATGKDEVNYTWQINDYLSGKCEIMMTD